MKAPSTKTFVVTLSIDDAALTREYLKYAIESLNDVITHEETYRDGNRSPILGTLKQYARDGVALLARLDSAK